MWKGDGIMIEVNFCQRGLIIGHALNHLHYSGKLKWIMTQFKT